MNYTFLPPRIRNKIAFSECPIPTVNGMCWLWKGAIHHSGYGSVRAPNVKTRTAHKAIFLLSGRTIPKGKVLDHLCRVKSCVNPEHLEVVTERQNILRGIGLAAVNYNKVLCIRNHPFDKANTGIDSRGDRFCRACMREHQRSFRERRDAKEMGKSKSPKHSR